MSDIIARNLLRQAETLRNNLLNHGYAGTDIAKNIQAVTRDLYLEAYK